MYGANESAEYNNRLWPRYIRITDIDNDGKLKEETFKSLPIEKAKEYLLNKGDILFARSGATVGKTFIYDSTKPACFAGYLIKAVCGNRLNPYFLVYYTSSSCYDNWKNSIFVQSTIPNIGADKYSVMPLPIPPLPEQRHIVTYLDAKVTLIDRYISKREEEIARLKEWKQALISKAVTKGLDPNAKMKDSGIAWIGEVPEKWGIRNIKHIFTEKSIKGYPDEPVLCATQSHGVIPQSMYENRVVVVNSGLSGLKLVEKGNFVISLRSFQGGIEYAHYRGIISAAYTVLALRDGIYKEYIKYLVKCIPFIGLLKTCVTGIREGQNINYSMLCKNSIMLPPLPEQHTIVRYIEEKTTKADKLISKLSLQVDYLKEYKQRLISDVVTGKINVQPE